MSAGNLIPTVINDISYRVQFSKSDAFYLTFLKITKLKYYDYARY